MNNNNNDDMLDLVDNHDKVTGIIIKRSKAYKDKIANIRVVNLFIINNHGKLFIPRRSENIEYCPLCLDFSSGGYVKTKETYDQAIKREVLEELNFSIENYEVNLLGYLSPYNVNISSFMKIYLLEMDCTPNYNKNEFCEYYWLTPIELLKRVSNGEKTKSDLPILVEMYFKRYKCK